MVLSVVHVHASAYAYVCTCMGMRMRIRFCACMCACMRMRVCFENAYVYVNVYVLVCYLTLHAGAFPDVFRRTCLRKCDHKTCTTFERTLDRIRQSKTFVHTSSTKIIRPVDLFWCLPRLFRTIGWLRRKTGRQTKKVNLVCAN